MFTPVISGNLLVQSTEMERLPFAQRTLTTVNSFAG
jgi:hypothetical protein